MKKLIALLGVLFIFSTLSFGQYKVEGINHLESVYAGILYVGMYDINNYTYADVATFHVAMKTNFPTPFGKLHFNIMYNMTSPTAFLYLANNLSDNWKVNIGYHPRVMPYMHRGDPFNLGQFEYVAQTLIPGLAPGVFTQYDAGVVSLYGGVHYPMIDGKTAVDYSMGVNFNLAENYALSLSTYTNKADKGTAIQFKSPLFTVMGYASEQKIYGGYFETYIQDYILFVDITHQEDRLNYLDGGFFRDYEMTSWLKTTLAVSYTHNWSIGYEGVTFVMYVHI